MVSGRWSIPPQPALAFSMSSDCSPSLPASCVAARLLPWALVLAFCLDLRGEDPGNALNESVPSASAPEQASDDPKPGKGSSEAPDDPRASRLRQLSLSLVPSSRIFGGLLAEAVAITYRGSGFRPIWDADDLPDDVHLDLSKALTDHAFPPLFALDPLVLQSRIEQADSPVDARDLAFTIAILDAGLLCRLGAAPATDFWPEWENGDTPGSVDHSPKEISRDLLLATAVRPFDPVEVLATLGPSGWIYRELREQFPAYREAILSYSGLPSIPDPASAGICRPGEACPYAPAIAAHLADRGYFEEPAGGFGQITTITPELELALTAFQSDYGLDADGIFGPATWQNLNTNAADRYRSLSLNMHRARILPAELGRRYAIVNLPCAELYLFEEGDLHVGTMRIVHGKGEEVSQHTPAFRDVMQEVVFGPYWNVPVGIAVNEIVPKARADWGFLSRNRYEIVSNFNPYNKESHRLSPDNLERVARGALFLRQKPGPDNALGRVKFLFPNSHHVYMHDTPAKNFFARAHRDLSHGCIRVSDPQRLGEWVLREKNWTSDEVEDAMFAEVRTSVAISDPIPVYIVYLTTFPRPVGGGKIVLAPGRDVYDRDGPDARTLANAIPWNED